MSPHAAASENPARVVKRTLATVLLWTAVLVLSLVWNLQRSERQTMDMAFAEAHAVRDKDMAFRRWGLKHQGVYVQVTESIEPSPYLNHVPDRDVRTVEGQRLTLRAPATMVREMMDDYAERGGVRGRIVGLRFLNPTNAPDPWEKEQLEAFEAGTRTEVWAVADMGGKPHLRYLQSWYMDPGCVKCHSILGYKVGDMRGATGVNLPLDPYYQRIEKAARDLALSHGSIWLLGLFGIGWAGRQSYLRAQEGRDAVARIEYLAHHDSLTALANRYSMEIRLEQALASAHRARERLAVMLIDMDRFKNINDTLGHHIGDKLLIEVAHRLRGSVRGADIVARLGGDEFVVVLTGLKGADDALPVGNKILRQLGQPYAVEGHLLHSTPSIGVSVFPDDGGDVDTLLKHADTAMYHAKEHGRNTLSFFTADLTVAAAQRMELERDFRRALAEDGLTLHFQPQVNAVDGQIIGFEALSRWHHPVHGWVPPTQFIPIAEESGLINQLGTWVLDRACSQLANWRAAGVRNVRMAVNLSAHQLRIATLVDDVRTTLEKYSLEADDLELEVTETAAMADPELAVEKLRALRSLGVQIAIDDFGTGYSSLAYLKLLPIQVLKIDRAFVSDIESDQNDAAICAATIALAKSLGLRVIAEGVETETQRDYLTRLDCDCLQGYLFGRPQPAEDCFTLISGT